MPLNEKPDLEDEQRIAKEAMITMLLRVIIGEDVSREGLQETPGRVVKAWQEWCSGYEVNVGALLKVFSDGAENYDEMVLLCNIPFYSHCEHHLAPFFGVAHVGYFPDKAIVGLSKIPRLVDAFARRLQVQERMGVQIADALEEHLKPKGVGVILQARHMCMESRGIKQTGSCTTTSVLRGLLREGEPRQEFMSSVHAQAKQVV